MGPVIDSRPVKDDREFDPAIAQEGFGATTDACQLKAREAIEKLLQEQPSLEPDLGRRDADVNTEPERQILPVRLTTDVEFVRTVEHGRIAIGGVVSHPHALSGLELLPVQLDVLYQLPSESMCRRREPQNFLDCIGNQVRLCAQQRTLLGIDGQMRDELRE
jgi:hypothetical protein